MRAAALMMGCVLLAGCPDAGLLRTAASADRAAFGRELQAHVAAAAIDLEQARAIAWRRASYEIGNAKGDDGARGVTSGLRRDTSLCLWVCAAVPKRCGAHCCSVPNRATRWPPALP